MAARGLVYGETLPYSGPLFREVTPEPRPDGTLALRVWFDHAKGLKLSNHGESGFEVAGPDHKFIPANAEIEGSTVVVSAPNLKQPTYVRYGWTGMVPGFLYNQAGLPAPTFTSEPNPQR